jgi:exodeoxyribonuclease VIII
MTNLKDEFNLLANEGKLKGIFPGIDGDVYHNDLPGVSKTDIEYASWSLANMVARKNRGPFSNEALMIGKLLHARLEHWREPEKYDALFRVKPTFAGEGARTRAREWEADHIGKTILTEDQVGDIAAMHQGVLVNPQSKALLEAGGVCEETAFWTDPESGVLCKCRPDKRIPDFLGKPLIVDWKTLGQFSARSIQDAIEDHNYHVSAAFTIDGLTALGIDPGPYVFVFIEKKEPNRVLCVPANEIDVEIGRRKYKRLLMQIAEAQKTNIWPGFVDLGLSDYTRQREMQALA